MATIEVTIRQDNGVTVNLSANPSDADVAEVVDSVLSFMSAYPMAVGSRPVSRTDEDPST